ncbi:leucine-rich repeat, cysteine-containing subtype protein [Tanacetum coccineum]
MGDAFRHAIKLEDFDGAIFYNNGDYSTFKFPSSIRGLGIEDLSVTSFSFLLPYVNQLRELNLTCLRINECCQCFLIERCPNLEVLCTDDVCGDMGLRVIGQICKKLRKLTHYGCVTHMGLIALVEGCTNLEYLDVTLSDISNEAIECVGTHLKNLRVFRMDLYKKDDMTDLPLDNGIRAMLKGCIKLKRLRICLCDGGLTDVGLGYIGKYGRNLRCLFLGCTGESDAGLLQLSKGCPKLRKLNLVDCPFSEQVVATFVFNIHSLRYIHVKSDYGTGLALTRPTLTAEVLTELKLYVTLAEKLHKLAAQLVADGIGLGPVKITYTSSRAADNFDTPLVRAMVVKGIRVNEEQVVVEGSSDKPVEIVKVQIANVESRFAVAISESGEIKVEGRVKDGVPHLTKVGALDVNVSLEGNIILCRQADQQNIIGRVGSILDEENVNISYMSFVRIAQRKEAVMVIGVDGKPSKKALKKIDEIPAVEEFVFIAL